MGGRGAFSYSGSRESTASSLPLSSYAVASLNKGVAAGTSVESAVDRFREQTMEKKVEYSAYIDDAGYIHALGSVGQEGETKIAPLSAIAKEKNVSSVVHNHPYGTSDGRKWGGPFSRKDMEYIASVYSMSNGKINRLVATAREGTYSAHIKKTVTQSQVANAAKSADSRASKKIYRSEKAMWKAVNKAYTSEFGKIGIEITFKSQKKKQSKLVTQKTGIY